MDGTCGHQLIAERELCTLARQWRQLHITSHIFFWGHSLAGVETALLLECCSKNWAATPCRLGSRKQGPKCTLTRIPLYHVVSNLLKRIVANIYSPGTPLIIFYFDGCLELNWCGLNPYVMNISMHRGIGAAMGACARAQRWCSDGTLKNSTGFCFTPWNIWKNSLVGGLEHGWIMTFHSVGNVIIPTDFYSSFFSEG